MKSDDFRMKIENGSGCLDLLPFFDSGFKFQDSSFRQIRKSALVVVDRILPTKMITK